MSDHVHRSSSEGHGLLGAGPSASMLVRLAEQAAACAPSSCGAAATLIIEGVTGSEQPAAGFTHPDLAPLVAVQWEAGEGPIPSAVRSGQPAGVGDLLSDERWPAYRTVALDAGVRSCETLPFRHDPVTVTVTLCAFRPGTMDDATRRAARMIGEFATRSIASDHRYEQALTEVDQLDNAIRTRPIIDQASGILMYLLGCDADAAFEVLRRHSQRVNRKLADVARDLVDTRGKGVESELSELLALAADLSKAGARAGRRRSEWADPE